jgi:hypothetical protein
VRIVRRRRVVAVAVLLGLLTAAWLFAPLLIAAILTLIVIAVGGIAIIPALVMTQVHGPGYQYRDDAKRR